MPITLKRYMIGIQLLFTYTTNRKHSKGYPVTVSDLTFGGLERSNLGHLVIHNMANNMHDQHEIMSDLLNSDVRFDLL